MQLRDLIAVPVSSCVQIGDGVRSSENGKNTGVAQLKCAPSFVTTEFNPYLVAGYGPFMPCQPVHSIGLIK